MITYPPQWILELLGIYGKQNRRFGAIVAGWNIEFQGRIYCKLKINDFRIESGEIESRLLVIGA